jgi:hypothetical protein
MLTGKRLSGDRKAKSTKKERENGFMSRLDLVVMQLLAITFKSLAWICFGETLTILF